MNKRIKALMGLQYMDHGHDHTNVTLWGLKDGRILKRRVTVAHCDEDFRDSNSIGGHQKWANADDLGSFNISGRIDHDKKVVTIGGGGIHSNRQVAYAIKRLEQQYPDHEFYVEGSSLKQWREINQC